MFQDNFEKKYPDMKEEIAAAGPRVDNIEDEAAAM